MVKKYGSNADPRTGTRLRLILNKGLQIQAKITDLNRRKAALEAELLGIIGTFEDRKPTDPIELTSGVSSGIPGRVTVRWNHEYEVNPKAAEKLRKQMGDPDFFRCFSIKSTYSRARSQSTWLKEAHGTLDRYKDAIKRAVRKVVRSKPTVKWEAL